MTKKERLERCARDFAARFGLVNLTLRLLCEAAEVPSGSFIDIMGETFGDMVRRLSAEGLPTSTGCAISRTRVHRMLRRELLIEKGLEVARRDGLHNLTREAVAEAAQLSPAIITNYFGSLQLFKAEVLRQIISREDWRLINEAVVLREPIAQSLPPEIKKRAAYEASE